jgi:hypothetical protein
MPRWVFRARGLKPSPQHSGITNHFIFLHPHCNLRTIDGCSGHGQRWWVIPLPIRLTLFWLPPRILISISASLPSQRRGTTARQLRLDYNLIRLASARFLSGTIPHMLHPQVGRHTIFVHVHSNIHARDPLDWIVSSPRQYQRNSIGSGINVGPSKPLRIMMGIRPW